MSTPPSQSIQAEAEPLPASLIHPLVQDPKFLAAAAAVLLAIVFYRFSSSGSIKPGKRRGVPNVLLAGPSDAGKTALFAQLFQGVRAETHTSMKSSIANFTLTETQDEPDGRSKQIRLLDLPGHPRLQDELKAHLPEADGVVFLVDVQAMLRNAGTIAELLPPLLTTLASRATQTNTPVRLLLLASKADLLIRPSPTSTCPSLPAATRQTAIDRIQSILTREMDRLKQTRASTGGRIEGISSVASTSKSWTRFLGLGGASKAIEGEGEVEEDEGLVWGGKGGFRWEDIEGVEIAWGAAALGPAKKPVNETEEVGEGLKELREWIWDI